MKALLEKNLIWILIVLSFGVGEIFGSWITKAPLEAKLARQEAAYARERETVARQLQAALEKTLATERMGAAMADRLRVAEAVSKKNLLEKNDALKKLTSGHACLGTRAVRVLNDLAAPPSLSLSAPPGNALGTHFALATDQEAVTDTDLALWAANARYEHDKCRARIDALAAFFNGE